MNTLSAEFHSADDINSSKQEFEDSLHYAFKEITKSQQKMVDTFQLHEYMEDLEREIYYLIWDLQISRNLVLKLSLTEKMLVLQSRNLVFHAETHVDSLSTSKNTTVKNNSHS